MLLNHSDAATLFYKYTKALIAMINNQANFFFICFNSSNGKQLVLFLSFQENFIFHQIMRKMIKLSIAALAVVVSRFF
jgi:hypothetical protein